MTESRHIRANLRKAICLLFLVICAIFFFPACHGSEAKPSAEPRDVTVTVMLEDADGVTVRSENPISVKWGEDATFELSLADGLVIDKLPAGATYKDGLLTLPQVKFPVTLRMETHRRVLCDFSASVADGTAGSIESSLDAGSHWSETAVTLTAKPAEGYLFAGFSSGATIEEGGEVVSFDPRYSFILEENIKLFANFTREWIDPAETVAVPDGKWVLIYHSNGGVLAETGKEGMKTVEFSNEYYYCPNALADRGYFEREGYALLGYNTKADGSGKYYGPGWNVVMPDERDAISLFCIWAEESDPADFEHIDNGDGTVTLKRYNGDDEFVVTPAKIDGKPVTALRKGCLFYSDAKRLMITKNIRTVEENAIYKCHGLEELYMCDSVTSITDKSFYECPELHRINMLAVVQAQFQNTRHGSCSVKYEKLLVEKNPKIIISSGSNCAYGVKSEDLIALLADAGYDYEIVNYSTSAGLIASYINDVIAALINEGDVLLLAPEISANQLGARAFNGTLWQVIEGAYDSIALVDMRNFDKFFSSFASFNKTRDHTVYDEHCYEKYHTGFDRYGESNYARSGNSASYAQTVQSYMDKGGAGGAFSFKTCVDSINKYYENLNRAFDAAASKGATVLMTFSVINKQSLDAESQKSALQEAYMKAVDTLLHVTRISHISTYMMDSAIFYDSDQHEDDAGRDIRTKQLAAELIAYFDSAKEGK